jgi:UDP:flavonoid glycosyltransferase YjiC (YdhE family)
MSKFLFVTWEGGGNVPPALGIATELEHRGHSVSFLGQGAQAQLIETAGFEFEGFKTVPPTHRGMVNADALRVFAFEVLFSPTMGAEVRERVAALHADAVVGDALLWGALNEDLGAPVGVLIHLLYRATFPGIAGMVARINAVGQADGQPLVPDPQQIWRRWPLRLVTSIEQFDSPGEPEPGLRYVGPVLDRPVSAALPFELDQRPLVLVGFSTAAAQASVERLQRTLDALADLPIQVLATAGSTDATLLRAPANATVVSSLPHMSVLPHAALTVTHGGHGTIMASLAHGVPVVVMPGQAADQAINGARAEALGVGRTLPADAAVDAIRAAAVEVLNTPSFRDKADRMRQLIARTDARKDAADALESLLAVTSARS